MHTVELLEAALNLAEQLGYHIRHEYLGGTGGGRCEFGGRRWIFIDLAMTVPEQLEIVADVLRDDPSVYAAEVSEPLSRLLDIPRAA